MDHGYADIPIAITEFGWSSKSDQSSYESILPGCDEMNDEIARNIAAATRKGGMGNVISIRGA